MPFIEKYKHYSRVGKLEVLMDFWFPIDCYDGAFQERSYAFPLKDTSLMRTTKCGKTLIYKAYYAYLVRVKEYNLLMSITQGISDEMIDIDFRGYKYTIEVSQKFVRFIEIYRKMKKYIVLKKLG